MSCAQEDCRCCVGALFSVRTNSSADSNRIHVIDERWCRPNCNLHRMRVPIDVLCTESKWFEGQWLFYKIKSTFHALLALHSGGSVCVDYLSRGSASNLYAISINAPHQPPLATVLLSSFFRLLIRVSGCNCACNCMRSITLRLRFRGAAYGGAFQCNTALGSDVSGLFITAEVAVCWVVESKCRR